MRTCTFRGWSGPYVGWIARHGGLPYKLNRGNIRRTIGLGRQERRPRIMKLALTGWLLLLVYVTVFTLTFVGMAMWGRMRPIRWSERAWLRRRQIR